MGFVSTLRAAAAGAIFGVRASLGSYQEATSYSPDRGAVYYFPNSDTRQYICRWTRSEVNRRVEFLFQNFGVIKEACRGMARHTVGKGISLSFNTEDDEWNAEAEADFEAFVTTPGRVDLAGRRDGYEMQSFAVVQRIKQGEFIAAFVPNPRWEDAPCVQIFDAEEVETPPEHAGNAYFVDGIQLDKNHNPVAIWVRNLEGKHTAIPAENVIHWYFADAANQVRGVSELAQAVAPMADVRELIRITTKTAKQNSAIGLHIKKMVKAGGQGALSKVQSIGAQAGLSSPANENENAQYEKLSGGGAIIYTDENGDAKFLTPQSPTPLLEPFIRNVLMRDGLASLGGAGADFFWACADLSGAGQRFVIQKADVHFQTLGDGVISRLCNPLAVRYIMHRMATGKLRRPRRRVYVVAPPTSPEGMADPASSVQGITERWEEDTEGDWMRHMSWQLPARVSIDRGDAVVEIQQLNAGVETLMTVNDRRGRGWRPIIKQWFREFKYAEECANKMGVGWALKLWRAATPGAMGAEPSQKAEDDEEKKPEPKPPAEK